MKKTGAVPDTNYGPNFGESNLRDVPRPNQRHLYPKNTYPLNVAIQGPGDMSYIPGDQGKWNQDPAVNAGRKDTKSKK